MLDVILGLMGAAGFVAGLVIICNLAPRFVPKAQSATLGYLAEAKLQTLDGKETLFTEAQGLSTLLPEMEARGVRLHAVVHQKFGASEFKPFLQGGEVYLDLELKFYGPQERWMNIPGIFTFQTLALVIKQIYMGTPGNFRGEGRLLGGLFVIGPGDQGIIFQHQEYPIGGRSEIERAREATQKVTSNHSTGDMLFKINVNDM